MVGDINSKKLKSKYLYVHAATHLLLLLIVTGFEKKYLLPIFLLTVSHLGIDIVTKILLRKKISSIWNFLLDQSLHLLSIAVFIYYFYKFQIDYDYIFSAPHYLLLIAIVSITYVSSVIMKKTMNLLKYPFPKNGIKDAGKYIGMLERLFIFVFIVSSFWEGVGFLLAAKSIFRFGDLKENKEIKLTEYILIGTLISFGLAILIAEAYLILQNAL
jgi:hypothetical protein